MKKCQICNKENDSILDYCLDTCLDNYCYFYKDNYLVNKYKQNHLVFELLLNT